MMCQSLNLSPLIVFCDITHVCIVLPDVLHYLPKPYPIIVFGIQLVQ